MKREINGEKATLKDALKVNDITLHCKTYVSRKSKHHYLLMTLSVVVIDLRYSIDLIFLFSWGFAI